MVTPAKLRMIKRASLSGLALAATLTACVTPDNVQGAPEDTWTWQVNQNYQRLAHCLTESLNDAPVHSWFFLAPRPITSFEQQWQANRIILKSIDPAGVEQVRIVVASMAGYGTRIVANAKNLEALGGGAPMVYVRAYVDVCARA
jgi:hypothetical protein